MGKNGNLATEIWLIFYLAIKLLQDFIMYFSQKFQNLAIQLVMAPNEQKENKQRSWYYY